MPEGGADALTVPGRRAGPRFRNRREAEAIVILGSGGAKGGLRDRLGRRRLLDRVVAVEPANRMTKRQTAARIRSFFPKECVRPRFLLRRKGRLGAKTWTGVP